MENYSNLNSLFSVRVQQVLNSRINSHGLVSAVTYLPQSESDIITLACWAMNAVGRQSLPCLVHILPARKYTFMLNINIKCHEHLLKPHNYGLSFLRRARASTFM